MTRPKPSGSVEAETTTSASPDAVGLPRDRAQPVGTDTIDLCDMLRDELRDRNHAIAARHHRVVAMLERQIGIVRIMERRDEAPSGGARRRPGAPGRGTAAGMDNVDLAAADDLRESLAVAPDHQRG